MTNTTKTGAIWNDATGTLVQSKTASEMADAEIERARGSFVDAQVEADREAARYGVSTVLWNYWQDVSGRILSLRSDACRASK